jgi:hypothetical protein
MATAAPLTDRDLASAQEARQLAQRAKRAAPILAEFSQEQIDRIVDAMAAAVRPQAEALARLAVEETGYGVVEDKVQKNLFASDRVYEFIRPMKTVGVVSRDDTKKVDRDREPFGVVAAVVPVHQSHLHRDLQDPDLAQGALPHRHESASVSGALHHSRGRIMWAAAKDAGAPDGAINWMQTGVPGRDAGIDEAPRRGGDSRHRRHGPRTRGVQRRQTGLWRWARQRPVLRGKNGRSGQGGFRHHHGQVVRQWTALFVPELGRWSKRPSPTK